MRGDGEGVGVGQQRQVWGMRATEGMGFCVVRGQHGKVVVGVTVSIFLVDVVLCRDEDSMEM